jgi:hypothetical protein
MSIVRITKELVKKAYGARKAALKKDPEFRAFKWSYPVSVDSEWLGRHAARAWLIS